MSWQHCLILAGIALIVVPLAIKGLLSMGTERQLFIPYRDINAFRTTPRFDVGSDVKDRT